MSFNPLEAMVHIALNPRLTHAQKALLSAMVTRVDNKTGRFRQSISWAAKTANVNRDTATDAMKSGEVRAYFTVTALARGYDIVFRPDINRRDLDDDIPLPNPTDIPDGPAEPDGPGVPDSPADGPDDPDPSTDLRLRTTRLRRKRRKEGFPLPPPTPELLAPLVVRPLPVPSPEPGATEQITYSPTEERLRKRLGLHS